MERGYVQVYTGDGKGKTTAALGLALRASGFGLKVYIGQFMKGQDYSELRSVPRLEGVEIVQYGDPGWVYKGKLKPTQIAEAEDGLAQAEAALCSGRYDVVILDEINMTVWFELIPVARVLALIEQKPTGTELILTGRRAHEDVIERADLVTEMREIKHYYTQKVSARRGIEN
ncbi:MAG: cob(I)yrinic acid a,c-diamide adenosyltransferase [Opitutales bacterium]